jgi:ATP-binding cassette subfamily B protein
VVIYLLNTVKVNKLRCFGRMLFKLVRIQPIPAGLLAILSIIQGVLPAIEVVVIAQISKYIVQGLDSGFHSVIQWLILLLICRVGREILAFSSQRVSLCIKRKAAKELKEDLVDNIMTTDVRQREKREFSDTIVRAQQAIDPVRLIYLFERVPAFVSQFLTAVSLCLLLFHVNWALPVINVTVLITCALLQSRLSKYYFDGFRRTSKEERMLGAYSSALMTKNTVAELRVLRRYDWMLAKWRAFDTDYKQKLQRKHNVRELAGKVIGFVMQYGVPALSVSIVLISRGLVLENVIIALQSSMALAGAVYYLVLDFSSYTDSIELYSDYCRFFDTRRPASLGNPIESDGVEIDCRDVTFSYHDNHQLAVDDVTLKVRPSEKIVLVGENGSGKTTLVKLILGLYKPSSGTIELGKQLSLDGNCAKISAVFQDFTKYYLSLRHNVGYGEVSLMNKDHELYDVLKKVNLAEEDYITRLDEQLGPQFGGRDFSHGQWQKIAVARGCLRRNHGLSVFDEPTASLDPITESQIIKSFLELIGDSTCIFVSHRLSSVKLADRIIVMKSGRIIEEGTHKELMALGGEYYRMFDQQAKMYA